MKADYYLERLKRPSGFYHFGYFLSRLIFKVGFRLKEQGVENIPSGSCLICANHISYFDPNAIGCTIPHPCFYFARKTLFENPVMGWLLPRINAVPIDQDRPDISGIRITLRLLQAGAQVLVFPEGGRSLDGKLQRGQPGVGLLAVKSGAPILPVRIRGTYEAWPRGSNRIRLHPITVNFGKVIPKMEIPNGLTGQAAYQAVSDRMMEEIAKL